MRAEKEIHNAQLILFSDLNKTPKNRNLTGKGNDGGLLFQSLKEKQKGQSLNLVA